jgi:rubrerythrin
MINFEIIQRKDNTMKRKKNLVLILGIGLFVSIGYAQLKDMSPKSQSDSTHQMNMQEHKSMKMQGNKSMKMQEHESMKMPEHGSMKMQENKPMKMQKTMDKEKGEEVTAYYTCSMESHKHIYSTEPGECPECGMKLVKAVLTDEKEADYYGCPMPNHSFIRSEKPGKCPECGMELKPMKLKKS